MLSYLCWNSDANIAHRSPKTESLKKREKQTGLLFVSTINFNIYTQFPTTKTNKNTDNLISHYISKMVQFGVQDKVVVDCFPWRPI